MKTSKVVPCETKPHAERVLIVDDDRGIVECVKWILEAKGYDCAVTYTGADGMSMLQSRGFDLVITDLKLPDMTGLEIIGAVKNMELDLPVILMTSFSSVESAIEALRKGAVDYIIKPFHNDDFGFAVDRAMNERRDRRENVVLKRQLRKVYTKNQIIGESENVRKLQAMIQRIAPTEANVLIQGESGTGKELVAQALHYGGPRAERPFVPVNCGAIPSELLESELFGHTKGAFTGAVTANEGLIRQASGGTLFLDEISEMPLNVQVKLLRVIQERQVRPVGSTQTYVTDTRFVAASNRNLKIEAEKGNFRADLFYRLNVIAIQVPPLRDRADDIEILAQHFLEYHCQKLGGRKCQMSQEFIHFLNNYEWPGNVRELENLIERVVILADSDVLTSVDLVDMLSIPSSEEKVNAPPHHSGVPLSIEEYTKETILLHQDTHTEAELAAILGIGRKALWIRRREWGLLKESK
ncbi:sigma-54 dependent transcriptional regulator [Glaciimonas sp. CA11.2]|uniref:sigma-54-dependent transcriptional regulator n=1 Tax=Glaciimonas sp. CA11.2 TaxID=3048601 RepID=UPI002AB4ED69|nr:sigma-54 dependent transcriptional regulator [Glaciimonas sp. CA11.2]MDY7547710.1 sigma-54 dependent transcriptional regulator [Glaciimonas sp. CA11.2]MEB0161373.1 sigma-54 dependent transcriptional regulator [Glaciimonas sp. CA11.2]